MKHLTLRTENQWPCRYSGGSVDLIRLSLVGDQFRVGIAASLLGFGIGLTHWHRDWEPIEHDGYAGEPQGREKAP